MKKIRQIRILVQRYRKKTKNVEKDIARIKAFHLINKIERIVKGDK